MSAGDKRLTDEQARRMLRLGDGDRERGRSFLEILGAPFKKFDKHPLWTLLVLIGLVITVTQVLPRDKKSELLDALTRLEHELVEQRARATRPQELALIDAELDEVRRKRSEVIRRFSRGEGPAPTSEGTFEPLPETARGDESLPHAEEAVEQTPDERREARTRVGVPGTRPGSSATSGTGNAGTTDPPPEEPGRDGPFQKRKTSTRPLTSAPQDGPEVHVDGPDAPRPAVPQVESWVHAGVLRLTLETIPRRRESAREVERRHRALVDELQWWLPGE